VTPDRHLVSGIGPLFDRAAEVRPAVDLAALAAEINAEHQAGEDAARKGLGHFRRAGEALRKAKAQCGHGQWLGWLQANVRFDRRTASNYMRVAAEWETVSHLGCLREALRFLANDDPYLTDDDADSPKGHWQGDGPAKPTEPPPAKPRQLPNGSVVVPDGNAPVGPDPELEEPEGGAEAAPRARAFRSHEQDRQDGLDAFGKLVRALNGVGLMGTFRGGLQAVKDALIRAEEAPPGESADEGGEALPPQAVPAFQQIPEVQRCCRSHDAIAREIETLGKSPAGVHMHWQSAQSQIRAARKTLWQGRPAFVCLACGGQRKDCTACRGHGFVTSVIHDALKESHGERG
jgi:hypothetical protein